MNVLLKSMVSSASVWPVLTNRANQMLLLQPLFSVIVLIIHKINTILLNNEVDVEGLFFYFFFFTLMTMMPPEADDELFFYCQRQ